MIVVVVIVAVLVVGALVAVLILRAMASGSRAASRSLTVELDGPQVVEYLDRGASFAATAVVSSGKPAEQIYDCLAAPGHFSWLPLTSGPQHGSSAITAGEAREIDLFVAKLGERAVSTVRGEELTLTGTGVSIPVALSSFAQRFTFSSTPGGGSSVTWTIGGTPGIFGFLPLRWTAFAVKPVLSYVLRGVVKRS